MKLLLITVEKRLDTGLTAQIGVSGEEGDKILVSKFNTPVGIDVEEGLIDLFLVDALEVETQLARFLILHNSNFLNVNTMQVRILRVQKYEEKKITANIFVP